METKECEVDYGYSHEGVVEYLANPFLEEIHGEIVYLWICEYHYQQLCDDI